MNEVADYFGKTGFIFVKYDVIIKVIYCNLLWWETLYEFYWKFSFCFQWSKNFENRL